MTITPLGDSAFTVTLGASIDAATHRLVRAATMRLRDTGLPGIIDIVPAFTSVTVHYDPAAVAGASVPGERFAALLEAAMADLSVGALPDPRVVDIPVCYGGELGPDLDDVARAHGMSPDEVVRRHAAGDYLVYMVGFMPGFAYLGGLAEDLATPRRASPRTAVPAGSVGIGGQQTGVYPMVSPGGWNLLGRTPLRIFDISRDEPAMLATGDRVRFHPIGRDEYDRMRL